MLKLNHRYSSSCAALVLLVVVAACERQRPGFDVLGSTMGTQYSITVVEPGALSAADIKRQVDDLLEGINRSMSTYDPQSELSRLNAMNTTDWLAISEPLHRVLSAALAVGRKSGGAFDVTVGPLVDLWGFGPEVHTTIPDPADIERTRARVGLDKIELRDRPAALRKQRGDVAIDLSGIAKGYGVDAVAELLEKLGVTDYLVEIGGELRARGSNRSGQPWRIGIEDPTADSRTISHAIRLTKSGMASSGNYRNFFVHDGVRYGHTIDPHTGQPVHHSLAGVTVLDDSAMTADAWATAMMTLGFARGQALAREFGLAVLFFVARADTFEIHTTEAFDLAVRNFAKVD